MIYDRLVLKCIKVRIRFNFLNLINESICGVVLFILFFNTIFFCSL